MEKDASLKPGDEDVRVTVFGAEVARLDYGPADTVVVMIPMHLSTVALAHIAEHVAESLRIGCDRVLVLPDGAKIGVMHNVDNVDLRTASDFAKKQ